MTKTQNIKFYKPEANAVYCMALHQDDKKLAISRADASLEIWNISYNPFIERTIAPTITNFSIEGLAWCGPRLFSVGLHGMLVEYDLYKLCVRKKHIVTGEAAFCLDVNKACNQIALGTEQGFLNIFEVIDEEVLFKKFLDKQEGRILCLKYDKSGDFVVSGGLDAIRIWNVETGHALFKLTTGRAEAQKPTIVWCLAVTQNFTIISGDSRGKLTFWDGKIGAQIESYQSHRADILSLCLSKDETNMYCAGIDPNISNYVKVKVTKYGNEKWVKSVQRKIHDHDVRALALHGEKLYSSGIDGYLACSYHPPKTLLKFPPILQNPCVSVCEQARYILLRYPKHLEVWTLAESSDEKEGNIYQLAEEPRKLLVLRKTRKNDDNEDEAEGIICSAMSGDGKWIMYSTAWGMRLVQFSYTKGDDKPVLNVMELGEEEMCVCNAGLFVNDEKLVVALNGGGLRVFGLSKGSPVVMQDIKSEMSDCITMMCATPCGKFLVASDPKSNICIWMLKNRQFVLHCKLPRYKAPPTSLGVHPKNLNLVVVYSDNHIVEFDIKNKQLTKFSRSLARGLPTQWLTKKDTIRNITFDPAADHIIILQDDANITVIDKEKDVQDVCKMQKYDASVRDIAIHPVIKKFKHLVFLNWLSSGETVAVEVSPMRLLENLPPCIIQSTFGRK